MANAIPAKVTITSNGGGGLNAWADGRYLGHVVTNDDAQVMVVLSPKCLCDMRPGRLGMQFESGKNGETL